MGIMDKLMFWKKEPDFNFDEIAKKDMLGGNPFDTEFGHEQSINSPAMSPDQHLANSPYGQQFTDNEPNSSFPTQTAPNPPTMPLSGNRDRDLELVNSKLDTIKALLNSIDQRISNLERGGQKPQQKLW